MDWQADRVVTAAVTEPANQNPETDNAIIDSFQQFFHDYPGPNMDYPYRTEIEQKRTREDYCIELDLEDLRKAGNGKLVDSIKKTPARYLPLVCNYLKYN